MKRYNLIILLMFLSVCAFAQTENNIIGTWKFLKINAIVEASSEEAKDKIIKDIKSQIETDSDLYMQFSQEGRWITSGSAENIIDKAIAKTYFIRTDRNNILPDEIHPKKE